MSSHLTWSLVFVNKRINNIQKQKQNILWYFACFFSFKIRESKKHNAISFLFRVVDQNNTGIDQYQQKYLDPKNKKQEIDDHSSISTLARIPVKILQKLSHNLPLPSASKLWRFPLKVVRYYFFQFFSTIDLVTLQFWFPQSVEQKILNLRANKNFSPSSFSSCCLTAS